MACFDNQHPPSLSLVSYFDEHVHSFIDANNEGASSLLPRLTRTLTMKEQSMLSIDNCVMTGEALDNCLHRGGTYKVAIEK